MKLLKRLAVVLIVFLVLAVGALIALALLVDPNDHKERIATAVKETTGRDLIIGGDLGWTFFPSIGFSAQDVTFGNADGFTAPHMAKMSSMDIAIKLLPLLSKRVQASGVTLNGLELNLETAPDGNTNWADLAAGGQAAEPTTDTGGGAELNELAVGFFALTDSQVHWIDRQADQTISIDAVNIETGPISGTEPIEATISFNANSSELKLDAVVEAQAVIENVLSEQGLKAQLAQLDVNGEMDTLSFAVRGEAISADLAAERIEVGDLQVGGQLDQLPYEVGLGKGSVDLATGSAQFANISAKSGAAALAMQVSAKQLFEQPVISGSFSVPVFDARAWAADANLELPQMTDDAALRKVSATGQFRYVGDSASLSDLKVQLDDTTVDGQFDLQSIERLAGQFAVQVDAIDVDRYLPPATEEDLAGASAEPIAPPDVDFGNLQGTISIGQLIVKGVTSNNIQLRLTTTPDRLELASIDSQLYEGIFAGRLSFDKSGKVSVDHSIDGLQTEPLLQDMTGNRLLGGLAQVSHDLQVGNVFAANPLSTLNGTVTYNFNQGTLYGLDIEQLVQQTATRLGYASADAASSDGNTRFSDLAVTATVVNGVLSTNDFDLATTFMDAGGGGSINLAEQTLDYRLDIKLNNVPEQLTGRGLEKLVGRTIPVRLTGSLFAPTPTIDVEALIKNAARDELQDRVLGGLLGSRRNDEQAAAAADGQQLDSEESSSDPEDVLKDSLRGLLERELGGSREEEEKEDPPQ